MARVNVTLLKARQNRAYIIEGVGGAGNTRRRLLDMGFTPDTRIFVSGVAPFGGTVLVGIRGVLVALRDDAASLISVREDAMNKANIALRLEAGGE